MSLNKPQAQINIDLQDVDGFTDLVTSVPKQFKEVDILIHSPGGGADIAERIVKILRARFKVVNFLVPHSAYSAATMLAMSGNEIILHPSATLGPIDPQINGIPARQIKRSFENLQKKISEEGSKSLPVYLPLIEKYSLHLLEICDDSEKLSRTLVRQWLREYMFSGAKTERATIIKQTNNAVNYMANFDKHLLHSRSLDITKLQKQSIAVKIADGGLAALLWEVHILLVGFFQNTNFIKIFESNKLSWGRGMNLVANSEPAPQRK